MNKTRRWIGGTILGALALLLAAVPPSPVGAQRPVSAQPDAGAQVAPQVTHAARFLSVVALGPLPGFARAEIPSYLSRQMAEAPLADWQFEPVAADFAPPADRVEWSFHVWGDDSPQAAAAPKPQSSRFVPRKLVVAELRLYLGGEFQAVTRADADIYGGTQDEALAGLVRRLSEALLGSSGAYRAIAKTPGGRTLAP